jgi:hypothetical protein
MLLRAVPIAEQVFAAHPASFVEVLPDGRVQSYRVRPGNNRRKPP